MVALLALLHLTFEPNVGQSPDPIRLVARGPGYALALLPDRIDVGTHYPERFPGIDLVVYTNGRGIEYDWIVHPGADPSAIRMKSTTAAIEPGGDLIVSTPAGLVRHTKPHTYQEIGGTRRIIPSEFIVEPGGTVSFRVGEYDPALTLIIDPQVEWVAAFGNNYSYDSGTLHPRISDTASDMAIDRDGNVWITGMDYFSGFPKVNAIQDQCPGSHCTFVAKLSPDGTKILFSSYIAAPVQPLGWPLLNATTYFRSAIACDREGNVYVTGTSDASRLPLVDGRMSQSRGGNDVFLLKLDGRGAVKARMVFGGGGDDAGTSVALGHDGFLYLAGTTSSADFPVSSGAYRAAKVGSPSFFVAKIDLKLLAGDTPFARVAVYSSLPGVSLANPVVGADAAGNAYIGGYTRCIEPGPIEPVKCSGYWYDTVAGLFKLNDTGTRLISAVNPFGSGPTDLMGIAVSPAGEVHIAGNTRSSDFPVTKGAYRTSPISGGWTGFVAKLKSGSHGIQWATYVAGVRDETLARAVITLAVDAAGNAYVGGSSPVAEIPELNAVQSKFGLTQTGFLTVVRPDGSGLVWSTPLGSGYLSLIRLGPAGAVYAAGTVNPGKTIANISEQNYGNQTIAVAKIETAGSPVRVEAVVNAASFEVGLPLAGGIATMWVDRPLDPEAVSILVGGAPAFIMWGGGRQLNFQIPFEGHGAAAPGGRYAVELRFGGLSSFALSAASGPGIFTLADGSGAVQHGSDYSLVSRDNPAAPGEVVIVYVTGLGYAGAQKTGVPSSGPAWAMNCYRPTANSGDVLYAGVTPGAIGVYQVNIRLRADLPSGDFPLVVTRNDCAPRPLTPAYPNPGPVKRDSNRVPLPVR